MSLTIKKSLLMGLFLAAATLSACGTPEDEKSNTDLNPVKESFDMKNTNFEVVDNVVIDHGRFGTSRLSKITDTLNDCTVYVVQDYDSISIDTKCPEGVIE